MDAQIQDGPCIDATPTRQHDRFQFGLRTLLLAVALAAIASWMCCIVWPWWKRDPYEVRFLEAAERINAGMGMAEALRLLGISSDSETVGACGGKTIMMTSYRSVGGIYCIYFVTAPWRRGYDPRETIEIVEVFRLAPMPPNYPWSPTIGSSFHTYFPGRREQQRCKYLSDFAAFLSSDRQHNSGFEYEVVYRDPPAPAQVDSR